MTGIENVGRRILAVGEVNPYGANPRYALYPHPRKASGNRLRLIMGLTDLQYLTSIARVNLCDGRWSMREARLSASRIVGGGGAHVILMLGAKVRRAFDHWTTFDAGPFAYRITPGILYASLPHPSGLCRVWNEPGAVDRAREVLRAVAPWVPWGSLDPKTPEQVGGCHESGA